MSTIFETERLIIRHYTMDDLGDFFKLNGDEEVMRYIRPAQTLEQTREFLEKIIHAYSERPGLGRWGMVSREDQQFLGSFAIIPVEDSDKLQLGYALLKQNWRKGYASESVRGGVQYAAHQLRLSEILGITYPQNRSSQMVLVKNGFAFDKTFFEGEREMHIYRQELPPGLSHYPD